MEEPIEMIPVATEVLDQCYLGGGVYPGSPGTDKKAVDLSLFNFLTYTDSEVRRKSMIKLHM